MEAVEFGRYLRGLRKKKKMRIRQLELYSGVSNAYLSQLENGKRGIPSPKILKKLYKPLGVDYEELMKMAGHTIEEDDFRVKESNEEYVVDQFLEDFDSKTNQELLEKYELKIEDLPLTKEQADFILKWMRVERISNTENDQD